MFGTSYRIITFFLMLLAGADRSLSAAENRLAGFTPDDTLTIRSAEARMDELPDIIHFGGGFELRASDWSLSSDQATLYGKLDDPETVVLSGSPAMILVQAMTDGQVVTINGEAERITYDRGTNSIRLQGNAHISRDQQSLSGGQIEYDIDRDHLSAGGPGGVQIEVLPEPGGSPPR